jgi:demethylspheroidene O-methyltransferase
MTDQVPQVSRPQAATGPEPATGPHVASWRLPAAITARLQGWRDRLLLSPAFHRAVFAVPGLRGLARRETRALFDICAGFVYSQVLLACVRLDLFAMLRAGPLSLTEISGRTGLPEASIERLATAAVSLRLLSWRHGDPVSGRHLGLGTLGTAIALDPSIAAMVEHHATLYVDLFDPVALLQPDKPKTGMSAYWPYTTAERPASLSDGDVATYTELMATSQRMISAEVVAAYDFTRHRKLLDVGGGNGTFIAAVAKAAPSLDLCLFDLPAVAAIAGQRLAEQGLTGRATAVGGDFYRDPLPGGADIVTLVRVLFDHDDASAVKILRAVHQCLPESGTLLIAEPMSGAAGAGPVMDAYFSFYLLAMGRGRSRSASDFIRLLEEAGFASARLVTPRNPLLVSLIAAAPAKRADKL